MKLLKWLLGSRKPALNKPAVMCSFKGGEKVKIKNGFEEAKFTKQFYLVCNIIDSENGGFLIWITDWDDEERKGIIENHWVNDNILCAVE